MGERRFDHVCTGFNPVIVCVPGAELVNTNSSGVVGPATCAFRLRRYELTNVASVTNDAPCRAGVGESAGLADCRAVHVPDGDRATVIL
jgi:hypothetical protein